MYQVATDYPKQIANIMAEYEARALNPRVNTLGPAPDSTARLKAELLDPFQAVFNAGVPQQPAAQPRTFEIGNNLVQLDPATGRPNVVFTAPSTAKTPEQELNKIRSALLTDEIKSINRAALDPMAAGSFAQRGTTPQAEVALKMAELQSILNPTATNAPIAAAPVAAPVIQPQAAPAAPKKSTYKIIKHN